MSANSDTKHMLSYAEERGLTVEKSKHGGYRLLLGDKQVAFLRTGGKQPPTWIKATKRRIEKALNDA